MKTISTFIISMVFATSFSQDIDVVRNSTIKNRENSRANYLWEIRQQYKRTMDSCIVVGDKNNLVKRHPYLNVLSNLKLKCAGSKEDKVLWLFPSGRYYVYHEGAYKWVPIKTKDINQIAKE